MSAFEFVFGLLSVVASLALTHVVSGVVQMLRSGCRPSLFLSLWIWTAFATTVGNWGGSWRMHSSDAFPGWLILGWLAIVIGQYAFCALVVPASESGREPPPGPARQKDRALFVAAFCALLALAVIGNLALAVAAHDLRTAVFANAMSVMQFLLAMIALRSPWPWSRIAASAVIAALATYWMVDSCQIVAGG
jgi:hypothetical protein